MNTSLGSVMEQIKHCEKFVELCDRIMSLERLQEAQLPQKRLRLLDEKLALTNELQTVCVEHECLEAALNGEEVLVEALTECELREFIKTADLRKRLLRTSIGKLNKQIEAVDKDNENSARELEALYPAMDSFIHVGFDPDTARTNLAALLGERERIRAAIKTEMSQSKVQRK